VTDLVDTNQPFYATLSKVVIPVAAKLFYTPIDVFMLMDKVIVHELMHTHQAYPLAADLQPNPYGKNTPLFLLMYTFLPHNTCANTPVFYIQASKTQ